MRQAWSTVASGACSVTPPRRLGLMVVSRLLGFRRRAVRQRCLALEEPEDPLGRRALPLLHGHARWAVSEARDLARDAERLARLPLPRLSSSTTPRPHPRGLHELLDLCTIFATDVAPVRLLLDRQRPSSARGSAMQYLPTEATP